MELARELFAVWGYRRFDEVGRPRGVAGRVGELGLIKFGADVLDRSSG